MASISFVTSYCNVPELVNCLYSEIIYSAMRWNSSLREPAMCGVRCILGRVYRLSSYIIPMRSHCKLSDFLFLCMEGQSRFRKRIPLFCQAFRSVRSFMLDRLSSEIRNPAPHREVLRLGCRDLQPGGNVRVWIGQFPHNQQFHL